MDCLLFTAVALYYFICYQIWDPNWVLGYPHHGDLGSHQVFRARGLRDHGDLEDQGTSGDHRTSGNHRTLGDHSLTSGDHGVWGDPEI